MLPMTSVAGLTGGRRLSIGRIVKHRFLLFLTLPIMPLAAASNGPVESFGLALAQTDGMQGP